MCGGLVSTADAAKAAYVRPATIRQWRRRKLLPVEAYDDLGRPLHLLSEVLRVERETRQRRPRAARHDHVA